MKGKIISGLAALVLGATSLAGCDEKKSENIDAKNCKAEFAKVQKKAEENPYTNKLLELSNRKWCQKKSSDWYDCRLLRNINYRGDILYCNALGEEAVEAAGYDLMMRRLLTNTLRLCDNNPDEGIIIFKQYLKQ